MQGQGNPSKCPKTCSQQQGLQSPGGWLFFSNHFSVSMRKSNFASKTTSRRFLVRKCLQLGLTLMSCHCIMHVTMPSFKTTCITTVVGKDNKGNSAMYILPQILGNTFRCGIVWSIILRILCQSILIYMDEISFLTFWKFCTLNHM